MGIDFYKDELRRIFSSYEEILPLVEKVTKDDINIFDSKTNISWGNFSPIVNAWGSGFITGYLTAKYGE